MLSESRKHGLALKFSGTANGVTIDNPLHLVSPEGPLGEQGPNMYTFKSRNGIETQMHDLRSIHEGRYTISFHKHRSLLWIKRPRNIFGQDGQLNGHHQTSEFSTPSLRTGALLKTISFARHHCASFRLLSAVFPHMFVNPAGRERKRIAEESGSL
jgi:hypothetical protein